MNSKTKDTKDDQSSETKKLLRRPKGQLVWIKNPEANENDEDNNEKPFYMANIIEDFGDKAMLSIAP